MLLALASVAGFSTAPTKNAFSGGSEMEPDLASRSTFKQRVKDTSPIRLAAMKALCRITGRPEFCGVGFLPVGTSTFCTTLTAKADLSAKGLWCHEYAQAGGTCENSFRHYTDEKLGLVFSPCGLTKEGDCNLLSLEPEYSFYILEYCDASCTEGPGGDCANKDTLCCDYDKNCAPCSEVIDW